MNERKMQSSDNRKESEFEEYVRSRANIVETIRGYMDLIPKENKYVGRCPFHPNGIDKELSVHSNQRFWCKSAKPHHGDIFDFVALAETVSRREAIHIVAQKLGIRASLIDEMPFRLQKKGVSQYELLTYMLCPLRYKCLYIDKKEEKIPKPYLIVGTVIHNVLAAFLQPGQNDRTIGKLMSFLNQKWNPAMFKNSEEENDWLHKAEKILDNFYRENDCTAVPVSVEKSFRQKVVCKSGEVLILKGRFDRLDRIGTSEYEVIDYKTFEKPRLAEELRNELGFAFYYFGAAPFCTNAKGPQKMTYLYLTEQERVTFDFEEQQLDLAVANIESLIHKIRTLRYFTPTPNRYCGDCAFIANCDATRKMQ